MKLKDLTPYQQDVYAAKICPYCNGITRITTELEIYGKTFKDRQIICCVNYPKCNSYVGTHEDGTTLGRLAGPKLRLAKKKAHDCFDRLWQLKYMTREEAYQELSEHLGLDPEFTHIGIMGFSNLDLTSKWAIEKYIEFHKKENR